MLQRISVDRGSGQSKKVSRNFFGHSRGLNILVTPTFFSIENIPNYDIFQEENWFIPVTSVDKLKVSPPV